MDSMTRPVGLGRLIGGDAAREAPSALPLDLRFGVEPYAELDLVLDPDDSALWCFMRPHATPCFTPSLLADLNRLHGSIRTLFAARAAHEPAPLRFFVGGSRSPGVFNLGGDLALFTECVRTRDRERLRAYAYDCVEAIYNNHVGFDAPVVSIGLLQGDALGGGFEAALSFQVLIAERGVRMGMPEALFNSFPGMGAYSLLSRRIGGAGARKLILGGRIHTAEEMFDLGLVDVLAEKGRGEQAAQAFIDANRTKHGVLHALAKTARLVAPLARTELRDVTDIWVDTMMALAATDLRRMERLMHAQGKRLAAINAGG